jgi:hypothetical protein
MARDDDFRELVKVLRRALLMIVAWCDAYLHRTAAEQVETPHAEARPQEAARRQ